MTETSVTPQTRWAGLGYQQVPGLANRLISRYLRTQRKTMLRFFMERGLLDLADRMRQIRNSRQGMLAKNQMFQKVLNDYAERATPKPSAKTPHTEDSRHDVLGVQPANTGTDTGRRSEDTRGSVPEVASNGSNGVVIEE